MHLAQSIVGNNARSAISNDAGHAVGVGSVFGRGNGAGGGSPARQAFQKGGNTWYGFPCFVCTVHGSNSSAALELSATHPASRSFAFTALSRAMTAGS